jgi:hypothetical protein
VTLDNLRVPFITDGNVKILSFRSKDPVFKADPGVVPSDEIRAKAGIKVVKTDFQHNELSDRGPDHVKAAIQATVQAFLDEDEGAPSIPLLTAAAPLPANAPDRVATTTPPKN